jgi:hypothetical protein
MIKYLISKILSFKKNERLNFFTPAATQDNLTNRQISDSVDIIIEKYIREIEDVNNSYLKTSCPLEFWSNHCSNSHEFREMAQLAKKFLSIQASSACCERLFNISGHIFQEKRRRLVHKFFSRLVFLKLNEDLL